MFEVVYILRVKIKVELLCKSSYVCLVHLELFSFAGPCAEFLSLLAEKYTLNLALILISLCKLPG